MAIADPPKHATAVERPQTGLGRIIPADTPTGLTRDELASLDERDLTALADWHATVAGSDEGALWWPDAVRTLPLAARVRFATVAEANAAWMVRERRLLENPDDGFVYFARWYGHVRPNVGPAEPFRLWPEQEAMLRTLHEKRRVVSLKARQLGITWLCLHYAMWLVLFSPHARGSRVLLLSKDGPAATQLLGRARQINELLPPFLRMTEKWETRQSLSKMKIERGGSVTSLTGSPGAARSETATFALSDEFAFIHNRQAEDTLSALLGTLGRLGRIAVVSTGNGDEREVGDGKAFAELWQQAKTGASDFVPIFLPSSTHPERTAEWMAAKRREYLDPDDFEREFPETEEQALLGRNTGIKVYLPAGINAAERLGRELDEMLFAGDLPAQSVRLCIDWGEMAGLVPLIPLEGGGLYFPPGEVYGGGGIDGRTVTELVDEFHERIAPWQLNRDGDPWVLIDMLAYDAAGVVSNRAAIERIERKWMDRWEWGHTRWHVSAKRNVPSPRPFGVNFGSPSSNAEGGGRKSRKAEAVDYQRALFKRAARGEREVVIACSPTNRELLRQWRGYELIDDGSGRIAKGDDHLPDAATAGASPTARKMRGQAE